ncbi:transposase [Methylobacterium sp. NPDC080182]|uniref:transposase n=1 Tax=Methylobacterium sp. NPDC080182 TaxID=3390590 RepID=UPI003CFF1300
MPGHAPTPAWSDRTGNRSCQLPRSGLPATHRRYHAVASHSARSKIPVRSRRSRYLGLAKTHLQHLLTATAINLSRLAAWIDDTPAARTRRSAFARLMARPTAA